MSEIYRKVFSDFGREENAESYTDRGSQAGPTQ